MKLVFEVIDGNNTKYHLPIAAETYKDAVNDVEGLADVLNMEHVRHWKTQAEYWEFEALSGYNIQVHIEE